MSDRTTGKKRKQVDICYKRNPNKQLRSGVVSGTLKIDADQKRAFQI
jgi:hypothetical protein